MAPSIRNRLLALGALWGLVLAALPALLMTGPYRLTGFLVTALVCSALSGCVGALAAGRRAAREVANKGDGRSGITARIRIGVSQGLVGGGVAALLFWALMALTASGFTLQNPVDLSVLMEPDVFIGSFFVALSVFAYALLGGLLLGPIFGLLVYRAVRDRAGGAGVVGGGTRGKEDQVVR